MQQPVPASCRSYRTAGVMFAIGLALGLAARDLAVSAHAQVMNPAQQRVEANEGISQMNAKMAEMLNILRTGTLKVRVVGSDKTPASAQGVWFEAAGSDRSSGPSDDSVPRTPDGNDPR